MYLKRLRNYSQLVNATTNKRDFSKILKAFATVDPKNLGPHAKGYNLVNGEWKNTKEEKQIVDPLTGEHMLT
jgi:hypothetical protein